MKHTLLKLCVCLLLAGSLLLLATADQAGGDKSPWQTLLPKGAYSELAQREVDIIREQLNGKADDHAIMRAKVGAVMLAAMTNSAKDLDAKEGMATNAAAFQLVALLGKKGQLDAAKKLAAELPKKVTPGGKSTASWDEHITLAELMDHLRPKDKGGDGMHPDLQSNIRLKGALNSIEEKLRALTMKELAAAGMKKEAKELELMGYRTAVLGSLTYYFAPPKAGKKDPEEWRKLSLQMRDQCVTFAVAAKKEDAAALFKVSNDLNSTCTQCHTVFRN